ncbi:hypothetical protein CDL15_Pgr006951 [Punica granatum]|uniref:Uncharacterized protein n=1 Tax=Punica granatum TaxID=22663 RepID=A0A218X884_PUNGR|nr:hypothetical protein CDL15_Pgr006951 [Punica granatum]PKI45661.1 hypothetical protein CRG98_033977 [Punica granatum]
MATKGAIAVSLVFAMVLMAFLATCEAAETRSCVGKCEDVCQTHTAIHKCKAACMRGCASDSYNGGRAAFEQVLNDDGEHAAGYWKRFIEFMDKFPYTDDDHNNPN